jgi:hypothetical protein
MSVFRVHKTENYTVMSNFHFKDTRLSLKAKGLLSIMLSLPENWDYNAKGLSTLSTDGEDAVKSALKELEENGYLKRTSIREKGVIRDWQYDIYENPKTLENIECEPQGEKPPVVEPLVAKQSQLNTNILNTKEINNTDTTVSVEHTSCTLKTPLIKTDNSIDIATPSNPRKKKSRWEQCVEEIEKFTDNEELREVLTTYLKMRLEMTPIFRGQWLGLLNNLKKLSGDTATQIEIVQQSINRGYKGFFEVKTYNKTYKGGQDKSVFSEYGQVKSVRSNEEAMNVQF